MSHEPHKKLGLRPPAPPYFKILVRTLVPPPLPNAYTQHRNSHGCVQWLGYAPLSLCCVRHNQVGEDKEGRTAIHMAIKRLFPKLTSSTCQLEDGSRAIKVTRSKFADG